MEQRGLIRSVLLVMTGWLVGWLVGNAVFSETTVDFSDFLHEVRGL